MNQREIIEAFHKKIDKDFTPESYLSNLSVKIVEKYVLDQLHESIQKKDPDGLVRNIHIARLYKVLHKFLPFVAKVLPADWHQEHEYLIYFFQKNETKEAVPFIPQAIAAKFSYMYDHDNEDDYYNFVRKCLFALADIGTDEALFWIRQYSQSEDPKIQELALEQVARLGLSR